MRNPGETARGGGGGEDDLLSALPDALLNHVMSFLRAWEVACTCVLSRRWRHLWATAPCVDLRLWGGRGHLRPPARLAKFAYRFLLEREVSAAVDTLRVMSSPVSFSDYEEGEEPSPQVVDYSACDVETWIRAAIKRRARVIHLTGHPEDSDFPDLNHVPIISRHLKHLKITGFSLEDRTLRQISCHCPCLEILELKCCLLDGREISSTSLKSLTMV
uniref:F-box domain-containing protein n=1 Tax=Oryza glumipatula TaxID=40148 RepID=A0A0E0ARX9_9ORYZ